MTTGTTDFIISYGLRTPIEQIPTPALALPQAAPRLANTRAEATPMYPKKQLLGSSDMVFDINVNEYKLKEFMKYKLKNYWMVFIKIITNEYGLVL